MKKQIINVVLGALVVLSGIASGSAYAQMAETTPSHIAANQIDAAPKPAKSEGDKISVSPAFSISDGEPLLLLVFGLTIFVAATTLKKKSNPPRT